MPARLRSVLTLGLWDLVAALHERISVIDARLDAQATEDKARLARLESAVAEMRGHFEERFEQAALEVNEIGQAIRHSAADPAKLDALIAGMAAVKDLGGKLERDIEALQASSTAQHDTAQRRLRAGLASAVNLISLLPQLKIEGVVPPFSHHGWEVTGEMAAFLFYLVRRHRPKLILELGSGSSTVLLAAALRANGTGRLVTVEHDPEHRNRTAQSLEQTELVDWVDLVETPLVEQAFGERSLQWYDVAALLPNLPGSIDILFIDGPPGRLQPLSRYPALPVLRPHLSPHALVVVDDGRREDEAQMIELWRELGIPFDAETLSFIPRAPVMLKMGVSEARIVELRRVAEQAEAAADGQQSAGAERRSGKP